MRYLFLMDEAACRNESILERVRSLVKGNDVVILSLGTLASLALRRMGFDYVTPDAFFSKEKSEAIDKLSAEFCRRWHLLIDHPVMTFRGVSIGQALEYEFYFLFIDAIRSVEIASGLLENSYDCIYVPPPDSQIAGHSECYNTLPLIVAYLSRQRGIRVITLDGDSHAAVGSAQDGSRPWRWYDSVISNARFLTYCVVFLLDNLRGMTRLLIDKNVVRFALNFHDDGIVDRLRDADTIRLEVRSAPSCTFRSATQINSVLSLLKDERTVSKLADSIVYSGIPLWRALLPQINEMLSRRVPSIIGAIRWIEFFADAFKPACYAVHEDISPLWRCVCMVLKGRGIPVVVVQHGILTIDLAGFYVMPKVGDVQAVWGQYYRKWHIDRGKPAETQVVTGCPRYDRLRNLHPIDREGVCRRFGLDPRLRVVLVATEWFQAGSSRYTVEEEESYIRHVLRSLKVYDDIQIVVKLHPGYQDKYNKIVIQIAEQEGVRLVIAKDSLWDLIRLSSFVIVSLSSVCVEALILGKRVISVNLTDCRDITGLVQDGLAIGAYSVEEINRSIENCMATADPNVDYSNVAGVLLSPFVNGNDGFASQRVAEVMKTVSVHHQ